MAEHNSKVHALGSDLLEKTYVSFQFPWVRYQNPNPNPNSQYLFANTVSNTKTKVKRENLVTNSMRHFVCQKRVPKTDTETGFWFRFPIPETWFRLYTTCQALGLFFAWEKGYLDVQHDATETFTLAIYTIKQWDHCHSELAF